MKHLFEFQVDPNMKGMSPRLLIFTTLHTCIVDTDGDTPLYDACSNGHLEVAEYLLDHGADPSIRGGSFLLVP